MTSSCQLAATATVLVSRPLTLYSDWHFCSACGLPPVDVDDVPVTTLPKRNRPSTTNGENIVDASINIDANIDANTVTETNDTVGSWCCDHTTNSAKKKKKKKLSTCTRCKTAAYHNSECQKSHWNKRGHKRDCTLLADAIQPLLDIVECWNDVAHNRNHNTKTNNNNNRWWWDIDTIDPKGAKDCTRLWNTNEVRWNRNGEYLEAMGGFQKALEPITKLWKDRTKSATKSKSTTTTTTTTSEICPLSLSSNLSLNESSNDDTPQTTTTNTTALGISLARKLLFCAYCEADGNQTKSARMRLSHCISILLECCSYHPQENKQNQQQWSIIITPLLNDAWMELMLSYEEERSPELRKISRHVAHMAIQTSSSSSSSISSNSSSCRGDGGANSNNNAMLYRCEWKDPLQRPGYMAKLEITEWNNNSNANKHAACLAPPYVPPEDHPSWCKTLESHWKQIAEELSLLVGTKTLARHNNTNTNTNGASNIWTAVGSGDRGSGGDDHRVVSAGGKWTEYVLFGTGATTHNNGNNDDADAPFTKKLLQDCVPDAVSLAEAGGGEVILSRLEPKTRIEAHCGPTNVRWTAHLGLVIPANSSCDGSENDCKICVADQWHRWETGKVLLFDDSYEHEIRNDTHEVRIVLLLRCWHPALRRNKRHTEVKEARRRKEEAVEKRYHAPLV